MGGRGVVKLGLSLPFQAGRFKKIKKKGSEN